MSKSRVAIIGLATLLWVYSSPRDLLLAQDSSERVQIAATYRVHLATFNLGDFHVIAKLKGSQYELQATGRFSFISAMIYRLQAEQKALANCQS